MHIKIIKETEPGYIVFGIPVEEIKHEGIIDLNRCLIDMEYTVCVKFMILKWFETCTGFTCSYEDSMIIGFLDLHFLISVKLKDPIDSNDDILGVLDKICMSQDGV